MAKEAFTDLRFFELGTTSSRIEARVWEQNLINEHGLENLLNEINSISPTYWWLYGIKK